MSIFSFKKAGATWTYTALSYHPSCHQFQRDFEPTHSRPRSGHFQKDFEHETHRSEKPVDRGPRHVVKCYCAR